MSRSETFSMPAALEQVAPAAARVRACLPAHLGEELGYLLELGVVEALTNIVRHGYGARAGGSIELACQVGPDSLVVRVEDGGLPLPEDRLARADADAFAFDENDIDAIPEGGRGLALLKAAFDEVAYESGAGRNRLTLVKHLPPLPGAQ